MHSGLDRRTVRQDMAPSQEELATSSGHYALGPWDAGRQQQRRLRRGGQSGGRDPNQGCCPQPPPLPGRWEVKEGGGHRDNVFRPLLGGAVPWRPGWGEEGKPGVRLEGLWRGWGGGSAGGVCSEVRGWPLPCARLGRTGDRMEALRPGEEKELRWWTGALPGSRRDPLASPVPAHPLGPSSLRFSPPWTETPPVASTGCARSWNRSSASPPATAKGGGTGEEGASRC